MEARFKPGDRVIKSFGKCNLFGDAPKEWELVGTITDTPPVPSHSEDWKTYFIKLDDGTEMTAFEHQLRPAYENLEPNS
jgi:hypothetical protein